MIEMANEKILVVDDEEHIAELINYNLTNNGYKVIIANNGIDAVKVAIEEKPSLILLDLMIPGKDGYDVCKEIRSNSEIRNTPIIMLTAKSEEFDKILGLELGADDYITKPFSVRELLARVKAVLRRVSIVEPENNILTFGDLVADFDKREILIKDKKLDLTLKEFELLEILIRNKGKILTRDTLLDKIWGYEYIGETRTVDVHVRTLRQKLMEAGELIETVRGVGYRISA